MRKITLIIIALCPLSLFAADAPPQTAPPQAAAPVATAAATPQAASAPDTAAAATTPTADAAAAKPDTAAAKPDTPAATPDTAAATPDAAAATPPASDATATPAEPPAPVTGDNVYKLMMQPLNEGGIVVARCNTQTGEGAYKIGDNWVKGKDDTPVPQSEYTCAAKSFKEKGWLLVRMDLKNGTTWTLEGESWKKVND